MRVRLLTCKKSGYMDEDECDSIIIRFFWYVAEITLRWNYVQWWIVDLFVCIGL